MNAVANDLQPAALPWQEPPLSSDVPLAASHRLKISWARALRWEFWPSWLYYIPIVFWLLWLAVKHRSLTAFTAANPALEAGAADEEALTSHIGANAAKLL